MKRNTFCVRFYCRKTNTRKNGKAPVECSIIVRGERVMFGLPKYCEPDKFKGLSDKSDIMLYVHNVENKINEIYTARSLAGETISAFILKDIYLNGAIKTSYTLEKMFADGLALKMAQGGTAYEKYRLVRDYFYKFTSMPPTKEAATVNRTDILNLIPKFEKIHQPQTVAKDLRRLKYFWKLAFESGKITVFPFTNISYKVQATEGVYLTQEEIGRIRDLRITNYRLDKVRDTFLFMCYTGLEYADMEALEKTDVQKSPEGQLYIKKKRVKTQIPYTSILYEDAVYLWDLYKGELPLYSNQKFNEYLKEIATAAGIEKNITTLTARHSYATYLLSEKGLSMDIVSAMLGHTSTKHTKVYAKMLDTAVFKANKEATLGTPTREQVYIPDKELRDFQEMLGI